MSERAQPGGWKIVRHAAASLCAWALSPGVASAQAMREISNFPVDCRSRIPPEARGTVQPWQVFVRLEHCDRVKRLQRLADSLPPSQRPRFFEGIVPASRLPSSFGVDMPVLRVVFPDRVFFDTDRVAPRPEARQIADLVADSLRRDVPDVAMFVAGHADARGGRTHNELLSIERANALAEQVLRAGTPNASIWRIGFGEDMPVVVGSDAHAWDRNRRVEFLFASKPEAVGVWLADQQLDTLCQARDAAEAEVCKSRLHFKVYEAMEVVSSKPSRVAVTPRPRLRIHDVSPRTDEPNKKIEVAVPDAKGVNPEYGRVYRINPSLRQMKPVRIRL